MIENKELKAEISARLRELANYMIYQGIVKSDKDLADKLSINRANLSQILNGKIRATDKFVIRFCKVFDFANFGWIMSGSGSMLKGENGSTEECKSESATENLSSALHSIEILVAQIAEKDRQIGKLIDMMAESRQEKNTAATKAAISAAASE